MGENNLKSELQIAKLSDSNYRTWKTEMKWYLRGKGLLDYVLGKNELSEMSTPEQKRVYKLNDDKAIAAIGLNIEPNQQVHIEDCVNSREAWLALEQVHHPKSRVRIMQLKKQMYQSKMKDNESMSSYISRIKVLANNLREAGSDPKDEDLAYIILAGLPDSYENLNMSLAGLPDDKFTSAEISKVLLTEFDRRQTRNTEENVDSKEALHSKGFKQISQRSTNAFSKPRSTFCSYCRKQGHDIKNCWQKNKARNQNYQQNVHSRRKENNNVGFLVSLNNVDMEDMWILDSGCTHHVCKHRKWFQTFEEIQAERINTAEEGKTMLEARGIGNIVIKTFVGKKSQLVTLHNVYYAPQIRKNLMSVSQIEKRAKRLTIENGRVEIRDATNNQIMCLADRRNDLYVVRATTIINNQERVKLNNVTIRDSML